MNFSINKLIKNKNLTLLLFFIFNTSIFATKIEEYSSDLTSIENENEEIKLFYSEQIKTLKNAIEPQVIDYIDSNNYLQKKNIHSKGILFTFKNINAKRIYFVADYYHYNHVLMKRNNYGVWYYLLELEEYKINKSQTKILYKFLDDRYFKIDANNTIYELDQIGHQVSVFYITDDLLKPTLGISQMKHDSFKKEREVIFRIYAPEAVTVSLVGSFNLWNSSLDRMYKKDNYFEIIKNLPPGQYTYLYKKNDSYDIDTKNPHKKKHPTWGTVSYLEINK